MDDKESINCSPAATPASVRSEKPKESFELPDINKTPSLQSRHSTKHSTVGRHSNVSSRLGDAAKFNFESRTIFDATENLLRSRGESYLIRKPPVVFDILTQPPPDFRPQAYRPRPPKRNSQEATQPWTYVTPADDYYEEALKERKEKMYLPKVLSPQQAPEDKFQAGYLPIDSTYDRMRQAGERGQLKRDMYQMPQPHDFRGYPSLKSLGLSDFSTAYERDPFNIKLHTRSQRTILGPPPQIVQRDIEFGIFAPSLHQPPKWEVRLHHPHDDFPNRPASYTRFRRTGRDPHSAFMERVTDTIDSNWAKQRCDKTLQRHQRQSMEA